MERDSKGKPSSGQSSSTAATAASSSRLKSDPGSQNEPEGSAGAQVRLREGAHFNMLVDHKKKHS